MTLTNMDESLRHVLPITFYEVGVSDHRFYDRYWFSIVDPNGQLAIMVGMGLYPNLDVLDGFVCMLDASSGRQHNLRLSRALRPDIDRAGVGPLDILPGAPYKSFRLHLGEGDGMALELEWRAVLPPHEEVPRKEVRRGRVVQDMCRYEQEGRVFGWAELDGRRFQVDNWYATRDHSWGVRADVGGWTPPNTASSRGSAPQGSLYAWLFFSAEDWGGVWQVQEASTGERTYADGSIHLPGGESSEVSHIEMKIEWVPKTIRWSVAEAALTLENGKRLDFRLTPLMPSWAMLGGGYDRGFNDELGHGVFRGQDYAERDTYDVSDPEQITVLDSGRTLRPFHRDTAVQVEVEGQQLVGHFMCLARPPLPRYGLTEDLRPWVRSTR
jgi:hypothetical protein